MGSGKTYCGKNTSSLLELTFVDLDDFISTENQIPVSEIFSKFGEKYFREQELIALRKTLDFDIISVGGGILTYDESFNFIKSNGIVIFLNTDFGTCYERIAGDIKRPNAMHKSREELHSLYISRLPRYNEADYIAEDKTEIMKIIKNIKKDI